VSPQTNDTRDKPKKLDSQSDSNLKVTCMDVFWTENFRDWFGKLRDREGRSRLRRRLDRLERGLFGDVKTVGGSVSEMRIHSGPGYRIYFTQRGTQLVLLLCGGDKDSQERDIVLAHKLAAEVKDLIWQ
jgi:putative addiction module killer protein